MIFVWRSNGGGGPLQNAAMLILFLVQLLPFILNNTTIEQHSTGSGIHNSNPRTTTFTISSNPELPWFTLGLTIFVCFIVILCLLAVKLHQFWVWLRTPYAETFTFEPIVVEPQAPVEMQEQPQEPSQQAQAAGPVNPPAQDAQPEPNTPEDDEEYNRSSRYWLMMGLAAGLGCGFCVWGTFLNNVEDPNLSQQLSDFCWTCGTILQFGGLCYMMLRDYAHARHRANRANRANNNRRTPAKVLARIRATIPKLPMEEFLRHDKETYESLKICRLKFMLQNRGDTTPYIEKKEMVSALLQHRKFDGTCCICCEDYRDRRQTYHPHVLRILPKCGHEFHLNCLDQWAYTFAHKSEAPSCPLCKTEFCEFL